MMARVIMLLMCAMMAVYAGVVVTQGFKGLMAGVHGKIEQATCTTDTDCCAKHGCPDGHVM